MANEISLRDLLDVLRRRKALVATCGLVALAAAALASTVAPRSFKCSTRIEVRGVQGVDARDIVDKSRGVQDTLRNRRTFDDLVGKLGLDSRLAGASGEELAQKRAALVDGLIAATPVKVGEPTGGLFFITIENSSSDAETAFRVCEGLAGMYRSDMTQKPIEDQQRVVDQRNDEVKAATQKLEAADREVLAYEEKNKDLLTGTDAKRNDVLKDIRQLEEVEIPQLKDKLARAEESVKSEPKYIEDTEELASDTRLAEMDKKLRDVKQDLRVMRSKNWTDEYPDVKAKLAELADLEREKAELEQKTRTKVTRKANSTWELYDKERRDAESDLFRAQRQLTVLNQQLVEIKNLQEQLPPVKQKYDTLVAAKTAAANELQERQKELGNAERQLATYRNERALNFTVIDPPQRPRGPSGPGPALFAAAGLVAGLALGCGVAYVLNMQDKSFREVESVTAFLGVPTLGAIHAIETPEEVRVSGQARVRQLIVLGGLAVVALGCVVFALQHDAERVRTAVGAEK